IYTAWVLEQLRQITQNTPAMDWLDIKVFTSHSQEEKLKANPEYFGDFRKRLYLRRVKREELHATPEAFLYFGKMSSFRLIDEFKNAAAPVNVIYSQWLGYLDGSHPDYFGSDQIAAYRSDQAVHFVCAHTSGHAPVADLQRLATALKPKKLVPIHTEHGEDFSQIYANVVTHNDGESWNL
ncbi:MAG: MBL fold metallo-hydrolase RNA specificity domain-containing protein, partial [Terracidiphilus sp.]